MSALARVGFDVFREQLDPLQKCRFCGCGETAPCAIAIAQEPDGICRLARVDEEVTIVLPCSWYVDGVCNAPPCIERLIAERRQVLLFDAAGQMIPRHGDLLLDRAADDRDLQLIGRELGIELGELSREAIIDRIRELRSARKRRA